MSDKLQEIKETLEVVFDRDQVGDDEWKKHSGKLYDNRTKWMRWLIEQLEQAQSQVELLKESLTAVIDENNSANQRLTQDSESYKAEAEKYLASNQKLVECLEWYRSASESEFYRDSGYRAMLVLSEVKGND